MTTPTKIKIAEIRVPANRRRLDPAWVATIMADIQGGNGHMIPIEVVPDQTEGFEYRLIFGGHRLAAISGLGDAEIDAFVKDPKEVATETQIRKREIAENLIRRQLSVLDRAKDIADWRDIYDAEHGTGKTGRKKGREVVEDDELSAKFALNFSEAAQAVLGISRRSVFHALKIATIPELIRQDISLHAIADSQTDLLQLASDPPQRQAAIARLLTMAADDAPKTVSEAIAVIDRTVKPAAEPRWQKLAGDFSKMKEGEQDRFFELHEAAIQRWLKDRQR
ncbi:ParB/RepB/Spo0J family partition protein [Mesorhizobium qingshengii]|uniref:Chromosome partitioning protein, ParB family n=1 Tax=Mesorhizobium qingshengii TaxID=1165689 RepID=A0A1G5V0X3_9HYPH|nr:ParB N-terminal domain-containing protein [Mesorhizobium qingshengii]SDA39519.1 chromosome partitioning protein, ParB family [Mesorhizobium qingshengii]